MMASFLEVFAEYSRMFGGADVGVFARWNIDTWELGLGCDLRPAWGSQRLQIGANRTFLDPWRQFQFKLQYTTVTS